MKYIYLSLVALATLTACNSNPKTAESEEPKTETPAADAIPEITPEAPPAAPEKPALKMADLAGHWEQLESVEAAGMKVSAKLTLHLSEDGTYKATQTTMGIAAKSSGKWSLTDNKVTLGALGTMTFQEDNQMLVDAKQNISLSKKQ